MTKKQTHLAILFADVAKSTTLYETLGDDTAQKVIGRILDRLRGVAEEFRGRVVKTIGDEVMCAFPGAREAVDAARAMQNAVDQLEFPENRDIKQPNIYVGFHEGQVIVEKNDLFGDAVNVAARMVEMAKPRQILTPESTYRKLPPDAMVLGSCIDTTIIKGKSGEVKVYEIVWEQQDKTVMADSLVDFNALMQGTNVADMELRVGDKTIRVNADRPVVTIGRQEHNDIVIEDGCVSRSHARVEYRRGRFFLVDESSNGTYVLPENGKSILLRRDETQISGRGTIFLGRNPDPDSPYTMHFTAGD